MGMGWRNAGQSHSGNRNCHKQRNHSLNRSPLGDNHSCVWEEGVTYWGAMRDEFGKVWEGTVHSGGDLSWTSGSILGGRWVKKPRHLYLSTHWPRRGWARFPHDLLQPLQPGLVFGCLFFKHNSWWTRMWSLSELNAGSGQFSLEYKEPLEAGQRFP